jgi:hypothetical protein
VKGNIFIDQEEIQNLRRALADRFSQLTDQPVIEDLESVFNSNMANYEDLYKSIDERVALKKKGINSVKPLLSLYYISRRSPEIGHSFRRKFIDCLYLYIYGHDREESILRQSHQKTQPMSSNDLKNLEGYWECFYYNEYSFRKKYDSGEPISIKTIAINIQVEDNKNHITYIHSNWNYGTGTIEIIDSNLIFILKNAYDQSKSLLLMNHGKGSILDAHEHLDILSGIYSFPALKVEGVKATRCIMLYRNNENVKDMYDTMYLNLLDDRNKTQFLNARNQLLTSKDKKHNKETSHLVSYFYKPHNLTEAYTSQFTSDPDFEDG